MKNIDTSKLSHDECWGVQINGFKHCLNCKWTGISACEGQEIVKTHRNSKGYKIGDSGLIENDFIAPQIEITRQSINRNG